MSLLMDALKKAEREKNRAASRKNTGEFSSTSTDNVPEDDSSAQPSSADLGDTTVKESVGETDSTQQISAEDKDENWAFDTGELELEPLAQKSEPANNLAAPDPEQQVLDDDTTVAEPMPTAAETSSFPVKDVLAEDSSSDELNKADFDHDATLPSERAIQSSLKDYFEASQSITMDQNSISGGVAPDITEHSVTSTSPLDTSATHVTAHTIFTAGHARQASTGLAKYALFGTLLLGAGLGAVALYYSFVTPAAVDMPETLPTVATVLDSDEPSKMVEVDVDTVKVEAPFEPGTSLKADLEDPVLAEVVEEVAPFQPDPLIELEQAPIVIQAENKVEEPLPESIQEPSAEIAVAEVTIPQQVITEPSQTENLTIRSATSEMPQNKISEHEVLDFTKFDRVTKTEPEAAIILSEQEYQTQVLKGGYTLEDRAIVSTQPIDVVAAEDFAEGLTMPRSAIRITKGRSHRVSNSDLTVAYQAYQSGDFLTAKASYQKVLNRRPDSRDARLGIAAIAVMEGNYNSAYRHYMYLLQQNPKDQVVNAALFNLQGNASGGVNESQLKLLLDQNPESPQVHFSLGSFYAGQSRWPEAQQAFFDAYSADKNNADYAYNLAVSLDQLGQAKPALSYYRTALKLADQTAVSFNTSKVLARIQKLSGPFKH